MLKFGLSATLLFTAAAVQAQPGTTPSPSTTVTTPVPPSPPAPPPPPISPPPAFIQAAEAFGQCVETASGGIATTVTPEAAAAQALAACAAQKTAIETQFEAWVASDAFPAEGRDVARTQFRAQFGQVESQIAGAIRQQRAAPAAPAATPTPSN